MLKIVRIPVNPFEENTYLAIDKDTNCAAVIDPGMFYDSEHKHFENYISENNITLTQILNTHMHLDHCFGANYVRDKYDIPVKASFADKRLAESLREMSQRFGMQDKVDEKVAIDVDLKDGDIVKIGNSELRVISMPGHTQGGVALYNADGGVVFTGDSLFKRSIGRTDLPGGNHQQLLLSVKRLLDMLPDDTKVLPGHGDMTTIGAEKRTNPFI